MVPLLSPVQKFLGNLVFMLGKSLILFKNENKLKRK